MIQMLSTKVNLLINIVESRPAAKGMTLLPTYKDIR